MKTFIAPMTTKEDLDDGCIALYERLKGYDPQALAMGLASVMVGVGFNDGVIEKVFEEVKANSVIARKNRKIRTRRNQIARLEELGAKKKLTRDEQLEVSRLLKALKA